MNRNTPSPSNLKELADLYSKIRGGDHSVRLNQRNLALLKSMIDFPDETAAKSISELAEEHGLHISSITRLAQKLGFQGFHDLKGLFRSNLKKQRSYYTDQVKHLLQQDQKIIHGNTSILNQVVKDEWGNVLQMLDKVDDKTLSTVTNLIKNAGQVMVLGLRGCYPVAYYLSFYLGMILDRVSLAGQSGHTLGEDLSRLKKDSLLIAISAPPYTKETIDACRICLKHEVKLVVITDNISSPLATGTNNVLLAPIQGKYFFSPIAAMMICVETLLAELVLQLGEKALTRLKRTETILESLQVEV
ncbi:MAG: hypothetical protein COA36_16445 [Desulfotalea sp.]|nr:MAG: hypothetical protein COA36_16445 [Desulfotalea sp.]